MSDDMERRALDQLIIIWARNLHFFLVILLLEIWVNVKVFKLTEPFEYGQTLSVIIYEILE